MWKESLEKDNGRHINGDVELGAFGGNGGGQQAQEDNQQGNPKMTEDERRILAV